MHKFCFTITFMVVMFMSTLLLVDAQTNQRNYQIYYGTNGNKVVIRQNNDPQLAFKFAREQWERDGVANGFIPHNNNNNHHKNNIPNNNGIRRNTIQINANSISRKKPVKPVSFGYWG